VCKAGSHGGPREWKGRSEGCEECDRVEGYIIWQYLGIGFIAWTVTFCISTAFCPGSDLSQHCINIY
jgi:hypothetical protein